MRSVDTVWMLWRRAMGVLEKSHRRQWRRQRLRRATYDRGPLATKVKSVTRRGMLEPAFGLRPGGGWTSNEHERAMDNIQSETGSRRSQEDAKDRSEEGE